MEVTKELVEELGFWVPDEAGANSVLTLAVLAQGHSTPALVS